MLNCPSPSLATGRSAPTGSDIPVSPAGDNARMPPVPRSGTARGGRERHRERARAWTPGEWTPIRAAPGMA